MFGIPGPGLQRRGEPVYDSLLQAGLEQGPHRLSAADGRVKQTLGAPPERLEESVHAIPGRLDSLYARAPAEGGLDVFDGREPWSLLHKPLAQELLLPGGEIVELEREDHHRPAGHSTQLGQSRPRRVPVMDRHAGHRRLDGIIIEGKLLRASGDRWR